MVWEKNTQKSFNQNEFSVEALLLFLPIFANFFYTVFEYLQSELFSHMTLLRTFFLMTLLRIFFFDSILCIFLVDTVLCALF